MSTFPQTTINTQPDSPSAQNAGETGFRPPTPPPPSYSPITPELSNAIPTAISNPDMTAQAQSHTHDANQIPRLGNPNRSAAFAPLAHPQAMTRTPVQSQPPQPVPLDPATNPDAIALRAAMSILQLQRQRALADMGTLEAQKEIALNDVAGFAQATRMGRITSRAPGGSSAPLEHTQASEDELDQESGEITKAPGSENAAYTGHTLERWPGTGNASPKNTSDPRPTEPTLQRQSQLRREDGQEAQAPALPAMTLPSRQSVVRMPAINWAQYHVVGESLDRMHEEQRVRPIPGMPANPGTDFPSASLNPTRKEAVVAAPYDPFVDVLEKRKKAERDQERIATEPTTTPKIENGSGKVRRKSGGAGGGGGGKKGR